MATASTSIPLNGLARRLISNKLLSVEAATQAQQAASSEGIPFALYLVNNKLAKAPAIAQAASDDIGLPVFDVDSFDTGLIPPGAMKPAMVEKHRIFPLFIRAGKLFVAIADPGNLRGIEEIKFETGRAVEPVLVEADKLAQLLEQGLPEVEEEGDMDSLNMDEFDTGDLIVEDTSEEDDAPVEATGDESPIVAFVNSILLRAIRRGASDIHFEPYEKYYRIRYRQDGILSEGEKPPIALAERIAARIKVIASLDISERRVPQDGRIRLKLSKTRAIDFRVSTCPTLFGEKIVMRILDPTSAQLGIDMLGYEQEQKELFMNAISKPQGLVLVTGPTGSGKTVSLYTALNILNQAEVNISTAEDPAEINLPGINQVNVNPRVGLTFSAALKSFLRQDPDIIMVGEIRDIETGEIAIKAAQTGHLVLSTLHTNDAPQTINRMVNMGIPPFNIASALTLIIAQRLARRLCKHCKEAIEVPEEALRKEGFTEEQLKEEYTLYKPIGCPQCTGGYKGRVGIYQVMPISEALSEVIMAGGNSIDIAKQADKENIPDLRRSAIKKAMAGLTSLEEVYRVTAE